MKSPVILTSLADLYRGPVNIPDNQFTIDIQHHMAVIRHHRIRHYIKYETPESIWNTWLSLSSSSSIKAALEPDGWQLRNSVTITTDENTVTQQYSTISYTLAHLPGTKFVCGIDVKSLMVPPQTSYKTNPRTDPPALKHFAGFISVKMKLTIDRCPHRQNL